ncbi:DNA repair protein RecO [uncultured Paraglaciecola sp.]|uniref:DNA repair protein RecO n=1 Tax=uncultured Paraglaciecola sp. TaxID=1765024 RepID=UPI00259AA1C9|nr:DNA repair protein RecO [uncultured Paraglaciecola sp.]
MVSEPLHGFVLHRRAYRETSYLTDLFTLEMGKISTVVRGVRGNKGDKKSLLQSFQPLLFSVSGKHELRNLNQLESNGKMLNLGGHQLFCAMYLNELLNRLLPKEVPHPELYEYYFQSLILLQSDCEVEPCLRQFELILLDELGYGIDLLHDFESNQPVKPDVDYCLVLEQGVTAIGSGSIGSNRFSGQSLIAMTNDNWTTDSLKCAKYITRTALAHLLGHKPLKSRELFQQTWTRSGFRKSEELK